MLKRDRGIAPFGTVDACSAFFALPDLPLAIDLSYLLFVAWMIWTCVACKID
jgi:hypothetical protein